ncbi:fibroblast growth factor 21 isoform X2 [Siniperca chuatsi]|uniref:fibroblast growth factor 21 isoform X2 n=1 Tax=Siniperca chuatsi TaxID=119488 RepID=UPI001CE13E6F|nr:fibroblast growth factor 21 isoform X2 [Siniperca chuatsi]
MFLFPHTSFSYMSYFLLIIPLPFSLSFYLTDSNPLLSFNNQVRERHLYTDNHRRGMYLQMTLDGRVSGSDAQTLYIYICCPFQRQYTEADCTFRELLLADGYTRFLSSHHGFPVSLASKHSPDRHTVPFTRFLPLRNTLAGESVSEQPPNNQRYFNMDSDDLLGMALNVMVSPQFSADM